MVSKSFNTTIGAVYGLLVKLHIELIYLLIEWVPIKIEIIKYANRRLVSQVQLCSSGSHFIVEFLRQVSLVALF